MAKAVTFKFDKEDRVQEKVLTTKVGKVVDRTIDFNDGQLFSVRMDGDEGLTTYYGGELDDEAR